MNIFVSGPQRSDDELRDMQTIKLWHGIDRKWCENVVMLCVLLCQVTR